MILYSVYTNPCARHVTYNLFKERQTNPYLSHVDPFPSWEDQVDYIKKRPYTHWCGAFDEDLCAYVGACWVDHYQSGVYVLEKYWGNGYGTDMMRMLIEQHPEMPYTAYIHPKNVASIRLHQRLEYSLDHTDANGQLVFKRPQVKCPVCKGQGVKNSHFEIIMCDDCRGTGWR